MIGGAPIRANRQTEKYKRRSTKYAGRAGGYDFRYQVQGLPIRPFGRGNTIPSPKNVRCASGAVFIA